jgi:LuxR family maltose regulon positive regulatory protein
LLEPASRNDIATRPPLVVASAIQALAEGDWGELKYWASVAALAPSDHELPDGTPLRCVTALLHSILGANGMTQVRDDASLAYRLDRPESPWRSIACLLEGRASRLLGQADHARARLEEGVVIGRTLARGIEAQCLAQLAILETDDNQWTEAAELAADAMNLVMTLALEDQPVMAMVFAVSALVHARAGPMNAAAAEAKHAVFLSSMRSNAGAWFAAETLLLAARTYLHLGDVTQARELLREARRMLRRTPDVDMLLDSIEHALARAGSLQEPLGVLATPLTPAEIRVLRFLPTHLTFPAIADELFVSRNTVKTQAISIYRKLGVSSRKPAVDAARSLGFLEP